MERTLVLLSLCAAMVPFVSAVTPSVGGKTPDFSLSAVDGKKVRLSDLTSKSTVVLVVLRGYPDYQCPYCNRRAQDFIKSSQGFAMAGVRVVMTYPGSAEDLGARANEFWVDKKFLGNFDLLLDPATQNQHLRRASRLPIVGGS